jgi:hypothetical protein
MFPKGGSRVPLPAPFSFVIFSTFVDFLFRIHNLTTYLAALPFAAAAINSGGVAYVGGQSRVLQQGSSVCMKTQIFLLIR